MTYLEALEVTEKGGRVRLPEWTGYWFRQNDELMALTRTGDVVHAWGNPSHPLSTLMEPTVKIREDWQEVTTPGLGFDFAVLALKAGKKVCRQGWNGKGMWLVLIPAGNAMHTSSSGAFPMQDCIGMKTAGDVMQPGWLCSQNDMLANDWMIAE